MFFVSCQLFYLKLVSECILCGYSYIVNTTILSLQVHWQIQSDSDVTGDFLILAGSVIIVEGQREAEIILSLMPDTVPELEELYIVQLTSVEGGGTLDANPNLIRTLIRFVVLNLYKKFR